MQLIKLPSLALLLLMLASCNKADSNKEEVENSVILSQPPEPHQGISLSEKKELIRRAALRMRSEIDEHTSRIDSVIHREFVHGCAQLFKEQDNKLIPSFSDEDFMETLKKNFPIITNPKKQKALITESTEQCCRTLVDIEDKLAIKLGVIPKDNDKIKASFHEEFDRNLLEAIAPSLLSINILQATQRVRMVAEVSSVTLKGVRAYRSKPSPDKLTPPGLALTAAAFAGEYAIATFIDGMEKKNKAEVKSSIQDAARKHAKLLSHGLKTSLYDYAQTTLSQYE